MLFGQFPFQWGPQPDALPAPPAPAPPLWTRATPFVGNYQFQAAQVMPRFEHIFPEADTGPQFIKDTDVVT